MDPALQQALSQTNFTVWDWGIVIAYLIASLAVGLLVKRHVRDMATYIGAGRAVGTKLGIAAMAGTEMGLITVMYSAQKGFVGGFAAFHIAVASGLVTLVVGLTGFMVYRLREMRVLTIPEFYERRFGRKTRILGGVMLALGGILNMGLFLKVGSMFIVGVTGMAADGGALKLVMFVLLTLVLVYTVLGGMISVVITDYIQFVILSAGVLLTTGFAVHHLGWNNIFETVAAEMGSKGFNPFESEGEFGVDYAAWMCFLGLVGCAIWPTSVARALAMESPEAVQKQFAWSSVSFTIRFMVPYFWGICAFVFIMTAAPDLKAVFFPENPAAAANNLYAMPVFLGRILPTGVLGLIAAAMIAAFMSTHDSYLLCWSSVITQDIVAPLQRKKMSLKSRVFLTRVLIGAIGVYVLWWGLFYEGSDDIWDYMSVTGAIYFTGAFAVMFCGLYWRRASSTGAVLALLSGAIAILGLGPVQEALGIAGRFTGAQVGLFTICFSLVVMVCGSLLCPDKRAPSTLEQPSSKRD